MTSQWKIVEDELVFSAKPWLEVSKHTVQLPDGKIISDFYQIAQPDYVEIVAVNERQQIQGMWHYKHGVRKEHLGLPAGYLEKDEDPLHAAKRELLEECQLVSNNWQKLGKFVLQGNRGPACAHIYMALDCQKSEIKLESDDVEQARMEWLGLERWLEYLESGDVAVIGAATAILLAEREMQKCINK